ncbi:MAG: DUF3153 domain-containing protein [Actinobacteria bacterium]|nr:MAG: DUF3153 domain-containing protein [Actinomycetota bacterium]
MRLAKRGLCLTLLLSCALLLPGCLNLNVKTTIDPDGSGTRAIEAALSRNATSLLRLSGAQGTAELERELRESLPEDARIRRSTRNGRLTYEASFDFDSVRELSAVTRGASRRRGRQAVEATLTRRDRWLFSTYTFSENIPPLMPSLSEQERSAVRTFDVSYRLTMPGGMVAFNGDEQPAPSTGVWELDLLAGRRIRATSSSLNWPLVGILVAALAALAAVVIVILLLRRRGKPTAAGET